MIFIFYSCNKKQNIQNNLAPIKNGFYTIKDSQGNSTGKLINSQKSGPWKYFNNQRVLDSVKYYYQDKPITKLDEKDFILSINDCKEFSIKLPAKWMVKKQFKQTIIIAVKQINEDTIFAPSINIMKTVIPKNMTLYQFYTASKQSLLNSKQKVFFKYENNIQNSGYNAIETLYFTEMNNYKLGIFSTYIQVKNSCFIVTCMAQATGIEFIKYKDLFIEITKSLKFNLPIN
jgi:hypothetical protein